MPNSSSSSPTDLTLGATPVAGNRWQFRVWAPRAERVRLRIVAPRSRTVALAARPRGYHEAVVDGIGPGTLYRYVLEGGEIGAPQARPDPASRAQPRGVHGPSACSAHSFAWRDRSWHGVAPADLVFYEVHIGAFTTAGTFDAAIARLPELRRLGVTALEIMPIAQFPGLHNWGYDGVYPFAVQHSYGGPAGFARLVDACHRHGLAVVLDVVYNHLGPEGNYLWAYGPYFTDRYRTPWGWAVNVDGPESDEVRQYFIENAIHWVRDFHVDGLRLDAIHAIHDASARPFVAELAAAVRAEGDRLGRQVHVIGECDRNDARVVTPEREHGLGLDAVWSDDLHHALHALLTGEREGYYCDFGGVAHLARAWRDGYAYTGQYSEYRRRRHGGPAAHVASRRFVVCAQNHDQVGNRILGDRLAAHLDPARLRLATGATLLSPYVPLLFMGEEHGDQAPFPYFADHGDADLVHAVRAGRREELRASGRPGEPPDPFAAATFATARPDWSAAKHETGARLRAWTQALLRVRREWPVLRRDDRRDVRTRCDEAKRTLVVRRRDKDAEVLLVLTFADGPVSVPLRLAGEGWRVVLDSTDRCWRAPTERCRTSAAIADASPGRTNIARPGPSVLLFARRRTTGE